MINTTNANSNVLLSDCQFKEVHAWVALSLSYTLCLWFFFSVTDTVHL